MRSWFVFDYYVAAGRPKAENAVMDYARNNYLHNLIADDKLEEVMDDIRRYHDHILEENKRWSPVKISLQNAQTVYEGYRAIYIGQQSLRLRRVKDVIE